MRMRMISMRIRMRRRMIRWLEEEKCRANNTLNSKCICNDKYLL